MLLLMTLHSCKLLIHYLLFHKYFLVMKWRTECHLPVTKCYTVLLGNLSRVLQDYAKSVIHNRLQSIAEEKEGELEALPTPASLVPEEDLAGSPTDDKTLLPPLKTQTKTSVEVILRKIKPQVHHLLWSIYKHSCWSYTANRLHENFRTNVKIVFSYRVIRCYYWLLGVP